MKSRKVLSPAVLALTVTLAGATSVQSGEIILVHAMNMDGGAWDAVHDRLADDGHDVTVVQLPMTSIEDDIAATRRAIGAAEGPVVLVGHSYGGMVISEAGTVPDVRALVYIAAFAPDIGESLGALNAAYPAELPQDGIDLFDDGFFTVGLETWVDYVANGVSERDATRTARSQTPASMSLFGYEAEAAAWRDRPVWAAVAVGDRTVSPDLQRMMASRAGGTVVEIDGGHLLPLSHPAEVASLIEKAVASVE